MSLSRRIRFRSVFVPLLISVLSLAAVSSLCLPARSADWPQFLGPTRNGISAETNLASAWPKEGPRVVWQKNVGQGFSGPVVASGRLILFHRLGDKETVECLDARTGSNLWTFAFPTSYRDDFGFDEGPRATPAIADGKVYTFGAEGALHCLDFQSGKKLWSIDAKKEFAAAKGFFGMACSPLVEGNAVLLNIGGSKGAGIVAFDKTAGGVLWKATVDEASYSSPVAATINGQRYAVFFTRAGLVVLDPASGKLNFELPWRSRQQASVNAATPLVVDGSIFLSTSYDTGAILLRFSDKKKIWSSDEALSNHYATSVHHNGFLYGFHGRQEHGASLRCVEFKTGKVRWNQDGLGAGTLMVADGRLLILTERGELILTAVTPESFRPLARAQILPFKVRAYPALANGLYYSRSADKLVCVDLRKLEGN